MYKIQLENFEGPLDLLLYFIRRDEIDIYDIPIARITREFMETLDLMQRMNLTVAGEFIFMAATLMRIKAKMMIPRPDSDDQEFEDPRLDLVQRLLEYQRFKEAADLLAEIDTVRSQYFPRAMTADIPAGSESAEVYLRDVSLYDIARVFKNAMERMPVIQSYELHRESVRLDDQKTLILKGFNLEGRQTFSGLIAQLKSKLELVVTFLALLDLMRAHHVTVIQSEIYGEMELILIENKA